MGKDLDTEIFNQIGDMIEAEPVDGKNAEGGHSEIVAAQQRGVVMGMRQARLRAVKIAREFMKQSV